MRGNSFVQSDESHENRESHFGHSGEDPLDKFPPSISGISLKIPNFVEKRPNFIAENFVHSNEEQDFNLNNFVTGSQGLVNKQNFVDSNFKVNVNNIPTHSNLGYNKQNNFVIIPATQLFSNKKNNVATVRYRPSARNNIHYRVGGLPIINAPISQRYGNSRNKIVQGILISSVIGEIIPASVIQDLAYFRRGSSAKPLNVPHSFVGGRKYNNLTR